MHAHPALQYAIENLQPRLFPLGQCQTFHRLTFSLNT